MFMLLSVIALLGAVHAQGSSLPEVDLGYEIYRAGSFNVSVYLVISTTIY